MEERLLGRTGLRVSAVGFGCGSIGGLFVRGTETEQRAAFEVAVAAGIRYFDSAPLYGAGHSEENLGRVLVETGANVIVGTKVRLNPAEVGDAVAAVRRSIESSLRRLRRDRVDLFQLHNAVVTHAGGSNDRLAVDDVLGPVLEGMRAVRDAGLTRHIGFTGLGETAALLRLVQDGSFETVQTYFNAINPSTGWSGRNDAGTQDYAGLIDHAREAGVGTLVIRPLAAGALAGEGERHPVAASPSPPYTHDAGYAADQERARKLAALARELGFASSGELALRFVLSKPGVSTVLIGFSDSAQLRDALRWEAARTLDPVILERVLALQET